MDALRITYRDFRMDMKSLPLGKARKDVKNRMSDFLERIRDEHGQDVVFVITGQNKNKL